MEKIVKLGDVLDYEQPTKYIVESTNYSNNFKIPVLTAGKTFVLGYTDEDKGVFDNLPVIIFDDFTTAFHYVDFPFKVKSSAMKILKPVKEKADLKFLYYKMQTISMDTDLHKRYWISKYSQVEIPLPPLATQQKIAAILDAADELRQKDKALVAKYDELTQALFLDMFGDPVTNNKKFDFTFLKEIIVDVKNGLSRRRKTEENEGEVVLRLRDIRENEIDYTDLNRISLDEKEKQNYNIEKSDLLFIRVNGNPEYVGRCAIFKGFKEPVYFNDHIMRVKVIKSINSIFLAHFLNSSFGKAEIAKHRKTSAGQHTINQFGLEKIKLYKPPFTLQNQFAERVKAIEEQKNIAQASALKSEELFNSLLQKAFNGELV